MTVRFRFCLFHAHLHPSEQKRRIEPPTISWATGEPQEGQGAMGVSFSCPLFLPLFPILDVPHALPWPSKSFSLTSSDVDAILGALGSRRTFCGPTIGPIL